MAKRRITQTTPYNILFITPSEAANTHTHTHNHNSTYRKQKSTMLKSYRKEKKTTEVALEKTRGRTSHFSVTPVNYIQDIQKQKIY